jgi:hypothetical protein
LQVGVIICAALCYRNNVVGLACDTNTYTHVANLAMVIVALENSLSFPLPTAFCGARFGDVPRSLFPGSFAVLAVPHAVGHYFAALRVAAEFRGAGHDDAASHSDQA